MFDISVLSYDILRVLVEHKHLNQLFDVIISITPTEIVIKLISTYTMKMEMKIHYNTRSCLPLTNTLSPDE